MNQNLDQNINGVQPPKKDDTLKIVLIIIGAIFGIAVIGIIGVCFLIYAIFNYNIEVLNESRNDIFDNHSSSSDNEDNDEVEDEREDDEGQLVQEYSNIKKLTLTELKNLISEKKSFVIVISQTFCSHCIDYKPKYNEVLKENNMIGYELDLLTLAKSEYEDFNNLLSVKYTPTTLIYTDGVVQEEYLEGSVTKEELTTFLNKYNIIK